MILRDQKKKGVWSSLCFLFALLIPAVLILYWHSINTVHPNDDCGDYFETVERVYNHYQDHGIPGALWGGYFDRDYRPIIFPALASPFLILSGGRVLLSVAMTLVFFYLLFLAYAYFLCREGLSPLRSALCTIFVGTIPWIVNFNYYFMSELPLMASSLAAIYHFQKSDFFKSFKHSLGFGFWLALSFCIRPIESTLAFFIPLFALIFLSYRKRRVNWEDLKRSLLIMVLTCVILLGQVSYAQRSSLGGFVILSLLWLGVMGWNFFSLRSYRRLGLSLPFFSAFSLCNFLTSLWWLPEMRWLYEWLRIPTGENATFYHNEGKMHLIQAIPAFFRNVGGYPLLMTVVLSCFGLLWVRSEWKKAWKDYLLGNSVILVMIMPTIIALSLSPDIAYRRAFVGFSLLLLFNGIFALRANSLLSGLRLLLFALFTSGQLFIVWSNTTNRLPEIRGPLSTWFKSTPFPLRGGDPSEKTFNAISALPLGKVRIGTFSLAMNQFIERPFDVSGIKVMLRKHRSNLHFSYPPPYADIANSYDFLIKNYDYVMIDVTTPPPPGKKLDPYERLTLDIAQRWERGGLAEVRLRYLTEFRILPAILPNHNRQEKTILLLQIQKPGEPRFSYLENLALVTKGGIAGARESREGSPVNRLNDGDEMEGWESLSTSKDTVFYISHSQPYQAKVLNLVLFSEGGNLRDLTVVGTNDPVDGQPQWKRIRSRIGSQGAYTEKITVPHLPDRTVVRIELDPSDPNWNSYRTFGLACFSEKEGYQKSYSNPSQGPLQLREFQIAEELELIDVQRPKYAAATSGL